MLGQKMFLLPKMLLPLPHLLQLHQLLSFSCFSVPNLLPAPPAPPPASPQLIRAPLVFPTELLW